MIPNLNENKWLKGIAVVAAILLVMMGWAYLTGGIFLVTYGKPFVTATPLTPYQYWFYYGAGQDVQVRLGSSMLGAFVLLAAPVALFFAPAKRSLFGDARFATKREIQRAGLLGIKGIIIGRMFGVYLTFSGPQHISVNAPTRGGKNVAIVTPNLLNYPESIVALDVKQESFQLTSAFREQHGQECYLFNPAAADYRTHRYNPLFYISDDPNFRIDDTQKIGNMLFPDLAGTDPIWTATPRSFFLGVVLFLFETPGKLITIGQVLRESLVDGDGSRYFARIIYMRALGERIKNTTPLAAAELAANDVVLILNTKGVPPDRHPRMMEMAVWVKMSADYRNSISETLEALSDEHEGVELPDLLAIARAFPVDTTPAEIGKALSSTCVRALNTYITIASDNTRSGIMTSFRSRLELWLNPVIDAATSANDFDLRDIRKKRMTIYVGVTVDNLSRLAPLINLFFQQLVDLNTRELPSANPALKHECLLVMDEFARIKKVDAIADGIAYVAGYGLRLMIITQSPSQIDEIYGKEAAKTFRANLGVKIVYAPRRDEIETANDISQWLGYQTVKSVAESKQRGWSLKRKPTDNTSDQRRALLLPQEISSIGKDKEIIVVDDLPPIMASKAYFYKSRELVNRLKDVSPSLRLLKGKFPTEKQISDAVVRGELSKMVPLLDMRAHEKLAYPISAQPTISETRSISSVTENAVVVEREATADDVPNLRRLSLSDFAVDFSKVVVPVGHVLDLAALHAYADQLFESVMANA